MKRVFILLAGIAVLAVVPVALAGPSHPRRVNLTNTSKGKILTTSSHRTLYFYTHDTRNKDRCSGACAQTWPLLTTKGKPIAGPGLKPSLLGTITIAHGVKQVTYAGHPLYMYILDTLPGTDVGYLGAKSYLGHWYALNASGHLVQ